MTFAYDLSDFKRFLNAENPKYRVDGLIFWQNRIPLPIDLFNKLFNEADFFFELYVDHLMAAIITCENNDGHFNKFGQISTLSLPSGDLTDKKEQLAVQFLSELSRSEVYRDTSAILASALRLDGYELLAQRLANAICHNGKKYSRLFLPQALRSSISQFHSDALARIGADNTDMFGNVIADRYNIYRSGFSDALAIIFNLLIDFRLQCVNYRSSIKRIQLEVQNTSSFNVDIKKTKDGSLWEPDYSDDHILRLNPEHPFYIAASKNGDLSMLKELLYSISKFENIQFSDSQRKLIENMRQEISRDLWIKLDS